MAKVGTEIVQRAIGFADADGNFVQASAANPLPAAATIDESTLATSAKQDTQITAEQAILAKIIAAPATETKQDTGNTSLASILAKLNASIAVTGTFYQATQPVSGTFWQATQPVSGTFWQATQPVSIATAPVLVAGTAVIGKVGIDQTTPGTTNLVAAGQNGTWNITNVSGTVSLPTGASTLTAQNTGNASMASIDTKLPTTLTTINPSNETIGTAGTAGLITLSYIYGYDGTNGHRVAANAEGLVVQSALAANLWNYAAATGGIANTTTAVTLKTAAGASVRNYIAAIQISWDALGVATELAIRDGAAGTVLWRLKIPASAAGMLETRFPDPLKGTANTLLEVVTLTASVTGGVFVNAQGHTGA